MSLRGVCTIALTPFTEDGDLDLAGIDALTRLYLDSGVHGLTILGIMGEAHKLSDAERTVIMERYISAAGEHVPVVVGCSASGRRHPQGGLQDAKRNLLLPRPLPRSRRGDAAGA